MKKAFITCILSIQMIFLAYAQELNGKATYLLNLGEDSFDFEGTTMFDANSYLFTFKAYKENIWLITSGPDYSNYTEQEVLTDTLGHRVFMPNMSEKTIIVRDFCKVSEPLYYKDTPGFDWQILTETKVIAGLSCQLAKTTFRGRTYEVWFSKEIPTSAGPWKFHGLPGLIVRVSDATGEVNIQLQKFEYTDHPHDLPELESVKWTKMRDLYDCMDKKWKKESERIRAIVARSRAESPDLVITATEAKRRPATELEFE